MWGNRKSTSHCYCKGASQGLNSELYSKDWLPFLLYQASPCNISHTHTKALHPFTSTCQQTGHPRCRAQSWNWATNEWQSEPNWCSSSKKKITPKKAASLLHGDIPFPLLHLYGEEFLRHSQGDFWLVLLATYVPSTHPAQKDHSIMGGSILL